MTGVRKYSQIPALPTSIKKIDTHPFVRLFKFLGLISLLVWIWPHSGKWGLIYLILLYKKIFLGYVIFITLISIVYTRKPCLSC
jgi:hypothetical protein